jgi:hypothetical protein
MTRTKGKRTRLGSMTWFALALGALVAFLAMPSLAAAKDRNHDRIPDRWERAHHLSLKVNQARRDQDHDGLRNRAEFLAGDDPRKADTDDDGIEDGQEKAGQVVSFRGGVLIVHLFNGDDVKGIVDADTEIECENGASAQAADDGPGHDGNEGGDDHGDSQGDDQGEDDNEANCDTSALTPGAVVHEAELKATAGGLVFREIKLVD